MIDWKATIETMTLVMSILLPALVIAILYKQVGRLFWYRQTGRNVPVILKRSLFLMLTVVVLTGSGIVLRLTGWNALLIEAGPLRFGYLLFTNLLSLLVLGYYAKTEYIDVEDPRKD